MENRDPSAVMSDLRTLRRSRHDRVLAGVCGGLARRLRVDPVILRVLAVVLTFFGGVGILLYAIGWLALPYDDADSRSVLDQAVGGETQDRMKSLATAVLLGVLIVVIAASGVFGHWSPTLLLVLAVLGLAAMLSRERMDGPPPPRTDPGYVPPSYAPATYTPSAYAQQTYAPTAPVAPASSSPLATPATEPVAWTPPPWAAPIEPLPGDGGDAATGFLPPTPPPPYEPPPPPPPRSYLGMITLSALVLVIGAIGIIDAAGADLSPVTYLFGALSVIGLGLLAGTWFGRSRGLIALGIVAAVIFIPVAAVDAITDGSWTQWRGADRVRERPTTVDAIQPLYELGTGVLILDLRSVDFTGESATTTVDLGAGEVRVLLPADVDVTVTGQVDLGELDVLGQEQGGADRSTHRVDLGPDGLGSGRIDLDLSVNLGRVEVTREAA
jgi:phage shock protein PspC (stress-responsive transcriptional regulator)